MKSVKVEILPLRAGEAVSGSIMREEKRGDAWLRVESSPYMSGDPSASRIFTVPDGQRLIIEGSSNMVHVYDNEQRAASMVQRKDVKPGQVIMGGDDDLSPEKPLAELAQAGTEKERLAAEERKAAAITAAREKLKQTAASAPTQPQPKASVQSAVVPPAKPSEDSLFPEDDYKS